MYRHLIFNRILQFVFLILTSSSVVASDEAITEQSYLQEFPVVLSASRLAQPISETPNAMTVIDQPMIKASGFRTVPELMRLVPGMYVGFADANRPVVSFHGATDEYSRRMQILIDGRSVYLPPFGGVSWADLPIQIEDIERIEVVRGPSSASHGTNSFYGVINIITREAFSQHGGSVSVTRGDATDVSARFGRAGTEFDYRVSLGYRSDLGLDNTVLNDHNSTRLINFRSNYHPNGADSFDVQLGSSNGVYGLGVINRLPEAFRETTAKTDFQQLSWLHSWSANNESKLTYSHNEHRSLDPYLCIDALTCRGLNPPIPAAQGYTQQRVASMRNVLELQNTQQLGDSNRLVWGGVMSRDYADFPLFLGRPYTINPWQVFLHDEWRVSQSAVLNIGTMFEDNGMGYKDNSPRASLNYHITPQHTVRFGVSTATRSPVMAEAYMDANNTVLGGVYVPPLTPLTPEKILSKEIGYMGEFKSLGVTVDARAYIDQVTDMIFWDKYPMVTPADSFKNMISAEYKGLESTLKYHWDEGRSFVSANYAYQEASASFGNYPTQYFSTMSPSPVKPATFPTFGDFVRTLYQSEFMDLFPQIVPTHSASLLLSERLPDDWQFSAGYYYRGAVRVINVSTDVTPETKMQRLDLRIAKTIKFDRGNSAEVALVVQNATRDNYTKYGTINPTANVLFPRRGWLTATLNF
ncbi:MAG: TonB-dependent receptor [Gallionella sp.]|nr:TonB-dependent receptor [Gallionella sp.]